MFSLYLLYACSYSNKVTHMSFRISLGKVLQNILIWKVEMLRILQIGWLNIMILQILSYKMVCQHLNTTQKVIKDNIYLFYNWCDIIYSIICKLFGSDIMVVPLIVSITEMQI